LQSVPVLNQSVFSPAQATLARVSPLAVMSGSLNFAFGIRESAMG
jgi:hypothetical protein